jgi:tetratricopeptide (TPR) repeat protein
MRTLFVLFCLALSPAARADQRTERARAHLASGIAYYDEGRYEDAVRAINEAYALKPLPELQYNLAQCWERLGRLREAVAAYRKYLDGTSATDDREATILRVQNLERRLAASTGAEAVAPPKVVFKTIVVWKEKPPPPGRGMRVAALAAGALAAGALAAGIACAVIASRKSDEVTAGGSLDRPVPWGGAASDAHGAGTSAFAGAWASFGLATLVGAGALGLWALGRTADRDAARVAVSAAPGGAGMVVAGRF